MAKVRSYDATVRRQQAKGILKLFGFIAVGIGFLAFFTGVITPSVASVAILGFLAMLLS